jgi:hypothetical protein
MQLNDIIDSIAAPAAGFPPQNSLMVGETVPVA